MGVSASERPLGLLTVRAKNYPMNITGSRVPTCQQLGNFNNIVRSKLHREQQKLGQCNSSHEQQRSLFTAAPTPSGVK